MNLLIKFKFELIRCKASLILRVEENLLWSRIVKQVSLYVVCSYVKIGSVWKCASFFRKGVSSNPSRHKTDCFANLTTITSRTRKLIDYAAALRWKGIESLKLNDFWFWMVERKILFLNRRSIVCLVLLVAFVYLWKNSLYMRVESNEWWS